jgi:hypothetical protein
MRRFFALLISVAALAGCKTNEEPAEPVVNIAETMMFLEPGLRPEVLLFPEYLMMEDFELQQHGRIPESKLIGAAMSSQLGLQQVRGRFDEALTKQGWTIDKVEIGRRSFLLMATLKQDGIEIRAVQGTGRAQIFILYEPEKPIVVF